MKKSVKNLAIATTTAAATFAIIGGNNTLNAQADTTPAVGAAASTTTTSPTVATAKHDVQTAQQAAVQTQSAVDTAKKQVNGSQSKAGDSQKAAIDAKNAVDQAKTTASTAQQKADQATDGAIEQAQADVAQQQTTNTKTDVQVQADQSAVATAQDNADQADAMVTQTQKELRQATNTVQSAQANVDATKQAASNTGLDAAQQKLTTAKQQQSQAAQAVTNAQNDVEQMSARINSGASAINAGQKQVDQANAILNVNRPALDRANNIITAAQRELATAKNQLGDSAVPLTADYFKTLNAYDETGATDAALREKLTTIGANIYDSLPAFVPNATDDQIVINGESDLTPEIRTQIAVYAASLLNELRTAAGLPTVTVTNGIVKFADDVAKNYEADDWDFTAKGHDADAINTAAKVNGLPEHPGVNSYENMSSTYNAVANLQGDIHENWQSNLSKIKSGVYYGIYGMLLDDDVSNWGHALSMLGFDEKGVGQASGFHKMLGTAVSARQFGDNPKNGDKYVTLDIHFLLVLEGSAMGSPLFDTTAVSLPKTVTTQADVDALAAALASKQAAFKVAKSQFDMGQQQINAASAVLKTARAELAKGKQKLAIAQTELVAAQTTFKAATTAVQAAQRVVDTYMADPEAKQQAIKDAQTVLAQAKQLQAEKQADLDAAQTTAQAANAKLTAIKTTLTKDQQARQAGQTVLATKQAYLASLQRAGQNLVDAQIAVQQAQAEYDQLVKRANTDQQTAVIDIAAYQALLAHRDVAKSKLTKAQSQLDRLQRQADITTVLNTVAADHVATTRTKVQPVSTHSTTSASLTPTSASLVKVKNENGQKSASASTLPQTNEQAPMTTWGAVLALVAGTLGLASMGRKRRQRD